MRSTALPELDVGVVVERRKATSMLAEFLWRPIGVFSGKASAEPSALDAQAEVALFYAGQAIIELHRTETSYYRDNLTSAAVWVILRSTSSRPPYELLAVTADPAEGKAFTDAGSNLVDTVPMPRDVGEAVVHFVARRHVGRPFLKRRRQPAEAWTAKPNLRLRRAGQGGEK